MSEWMKAETTNEMKWKKTMRNAARRILLVTPFLSRLASIKHGFFCSTHFPCRRCSNQNFLLSLGTQIFIERWKINQAEHFQLNSVCLRNNYRMLKFKPKLFPTNNKQTNTRRQWRRRRRRWGRRNHLTNVMHSDKAQNIINSRLV